MSQDGPFFVVGSGRSGSTLLRLILSNHPRLYVSPETWFIADLVRELPLAEPLSREQLERAVAIVTTHYRWPDLGLDAGELASAAAKLDRPRLREVLDLVYTPLLRRSGKQRLGDKTPPYIGILPQLAGLYPEALFVHLIRDGRDVAMSFIELGDGCRYYDGRRFEWIAAMELARRWRKSEYADRLLEVKYEDLVSRPELTLRGICAFLGEPFEAQMLQTAPQLEAVPERERSIHSNVKRPLSKESTERWRSGLSGTECLCMEACLTGYLTELGYKLRFRHAWRPLLSLLGLLLRFAAPLLDRGIPFLQRRHLFPRAIYF